jgi:hypothetical protein
MTKKIDYSWSYAMIALLDEEIALDLANEMENK